MNSGKRDEALARLAALIASDRAGPETLKLAEYFATVKGGRQPFGAKHRWIEIGQDNDTMRAKGYSQAKRMEKITAKYRIYDESKLRTYIAKYERAMEEVRGIDWENRG
jgi:hypothetical protein